MMIALATLLAVSGIIMSALLQMTLTQGTVSNRTEMHSSVRSATEVLQQEIGQAGRVSLPGPVTLSGAVAITGTATGVVVSSAAGMFTGEQLVIDTGANQETVALTNVDASTNTSTAVFNNIHASGVPVTVAGAFSSGIVPTNMANGSTGTVLKLYGDINADGNMVYVEYTCDVVAHKLYRNMIPLAMPLNQPAKPAVSDSQILLSNIIANPGGTPCFSYQTSIVPAQGSQFTFVLDVAVTLTV